ARTRAIMRANTNVVTYGPVTRGSTSAMASVAKASNQPSPAASARFFPLDPELRRVDRLLPSSLLGEVADGPEAGAPTPPRCIIPISLDEERASNPNLSRVRTPWNAP